VTHRIVVIGDIHYQLNRLEVILEDHPNNLRWQRTLAKNPEVYLKEDSPLQAYLMTQLTPDDVDGVRKILVYCNF